MSSPEQNYFLRYAMRYPVIQVVLLFSKVEKVHRWTFDKGLCREEGLKRRQPQGNDWNFGRLIFQRELPRALLLCHQYALGMDHYSIGISENRFKQKSPKSNFKIQKCSSKLITKKNQIESPLISQPLLSSFHFHYCKIVEIQKYTFCGK